MTEKEIKEATIEDAIYCAKAMACIEVCEECRFYRLCHTWCDDVYRLIVDALEEVQSYRAIGTIEEFKSLKEKSVEKKPHSISIANDIGNSMVECPICHARSDYDVESIKRGYCWKCGQKLDWSE